MTYGETVRVLLPDVFVALTALLTLMPSARAQSEAMVSALEAPSIPLLEWSFTPVDITVTAGGSVTWSTQGFLDHTVTADDGSFNGAIARGRPSTLIFSTAGVYSYFCTPHPWMRGSVTVVAGPLPSGELLQMPVADTPMDSAEE